jgi:inner membrane protein YidH
VSDAEAADVSRRTRLAAERTWLAWWRSGIAATAASLAVGAFVPDLIEGARWPYVILGVGYATLAVSMFVMGEARKRSVDRALDEGGYAPLPGTWTVALSGAGGLLAVVTLLVVLLT